MKTVHFLMPSLPDLEGALVAFLKGAEKTFSERFSDEFVKGGDIERLAAEDREHLYFASTNDVNEGGLGSWRRGQAQRPSETLHKFNSGFISRRNEAEVFHQQKLSTEEDEAYLRKVARRRDAQKNQKQIKEAQMAADARKVVENRGKENKRQEKRDTRAAAIFETGKHLILTDVEINKLNVQELNQQLDWYRDNEKRYKNLTERVPFKSKIGNKSERLAELKKAVERYKTFNPLSLPPKNASDDIEMAESRADDALYVSDYEDNLV